MKILMMLILIVSTASIHAATFTFSETKIKLNNLAGIDLKDVQASYWLECKYPVFYSSKNCGETISLELNKRDADGNIIFPELTYKYASGRKNRISLTLHLKVKGEEVIFHRGSAGQVVNTENYSKLLSKLTILSMKPSQKISTTVDGQPLEQWLRKTKVKSVKINMWIQAANNASVHLQEELTQNTQSLTPHIRYAGFPGNVDVSVLKISRSVYLGSTSLLHDSFEFPFSRDLPLEMRTLDLSTAHIAKKIDGNWSAYLDFDEVALAAKEGYRAEYYTAYMKIACDERGQISGKLKSSYAHNYVLTHFETSLSGSCEKLPYLITVSQFPLSFTKGRNEEQTSYLDVQDMMIKVNFVADGDLHAVLINSAGKEVGELAFTHRLNEYPAK